MNHFNLLPPEIFGTIFKKLNLDDLIKLRTIDRRFKVICDQFRIKELCLHDDGNLYVNESIKSWFYTHDFLNFNKGIISESWFHRDHRDDTIINFKKINVRAFYKLTKYKPVYQLFEHLRRLALCVDYFDFSVLNHFEFLEQLQIATHLASDYRISLGHLKIIQIDILVDNDRKLNSRFEPRTKYLFRANLASTT